jgi:predicted small lipoprotein YifL
VTAGARRRSLRIAVLGGIVVAGGLAGCGQRGPLVLPQDARPVEPAPNGPAAEPEQQDDERENER